MAVTLLGLSRWIWSAGEGEGRRGGKCSTRMSLREAAAGDVDRPASGECFRSVRLLGAVKQTGGCEEAAWGRGGEGSRELHGPRTDRLLLFFTITKRDRERDAVNSGSAGEGNDVMKYATPQPADAH